MSRSRLFATVAAFAAWGVWSIVSLVLLTLARAGGLFLATYVIYLVSGAIFLAASRRDLLAPPGLFTLTGFFAFGLSIPLIFRGNRYIETSDVTSFEVTDDSLLKALVIFLVAQTAFMIGYYLKLLRHVPVARVLGTAPATRKVSLLTYALLAFLVAVSGAIRIQLHLGEAGVQPAFAYAGYLQYALFDGTLIFCAWFLAQGLRQSPVYVLLGLSLLVMMALAQALLGWRGGIAQVGWVILGIFWYQMPAGEKKPYSFIWLMVLPLVAGSIVQFGNAVRAERLGGEKEFAASTGDMIEKIAYRSQGTTRLAVVAEKLGPLTLFNDFLIVDLAEEGLTTTTYVDRKYYAVGVRQSHSVGTSGPGGPYVGMGLFGVLIAYMLLGAFYRAVYGCVVDSDARYGNIVGTVLYSYLTFILSALLSENFGIAFIKNMIAVFALVVALKIFIKDRGVHENQPLHTTAAAGSPSVVPRARIEP